MSHTIKRKTTLPRSLRGANFTNYEKARSAVRKYIRANYQTQPRENPPIGLYGFSVVTA
mgnify:CR=1 FL=1|jgi:hypothetical protein